MRLLADIVFGIISCIGCIISTTLMILYSILGWMRAFVYHNPIGPVMESVFISLIFLVFSIICLIGLIVFYSDYKSIKNKKK